MDFRRADPTYVNFVPRTCVDAIDLFHRHRTLGLTSNLYPECFVHCARGLPDAELDMFHRFIVNPSGDIASGGAPTEVDRELEAERKVLLHEACARDAVQSPDDVVGTIDAIPEEDEKMPDAIPEEEDEKMPDAEPSKDSYLLIST